jgi:hypothetical protein
VSELLDAHIGQEIAGGCDTCSAVQTVRRETEGVYRMTVAHDDGCPVLAFHTDILPLKTQLAELRREWHMWNDVAPEQLAERDDLDLSEIVPEARGDRVLAARAWRAGILAQLEVLGAALAERLEGLEGGAR